MCSEALDAQVLHNHGFMRDQYGNITTFDATGGGTGQYQGTLPLSVNDNGRIAGYEVRNNTTYVCFTRDQSGNFTVFTLKGSGRALSESIKANGTITGYYIDFNNVGHGFIRF